METKIVKCKKEDIEYLEALFYEYNAKKDIINTIFDQHQFDDNDSVLKSVVFKSYEKEFAECKIKYDHMMQEVQEKYVSKEYQEQGCRWEVDFDKEEIKIYPL